MNNIYNNPDSNGFYWFNHKQINKGISTIVEIKSDRNGKLCVFFLNTKKYILLDNIKNGLWFGPIEVPDELNNDNILYNCSKCGGQPEIDYIDKGYYHGSPFYEYRVFCTKCGATTNIYNSEKEAIKEWNNELFNGVIKNNKSNTVINKCWICGETPVIKVKDVSYHGSPIYEYQLVCTGCSSHTKFYASEREAIEKWNNEATLISTQINKL